MVQDEPRAVQVVQCHQHGAGGARAPSALQVVRCTQCGTCVALHLLRNRWCSAKSMVQDVRAPSEEQACGAFVVVQVEPRAVQVVQFTEHVAVD